MPEPLFWRLRRQPRKANGMISGVLRAMADDVETRSTTTSDGHRQPTEEQQTAKAAKIRAVAQEFRALADDAETRNVRYEEFDALKGRLYAFGFDLDPKLVENVAAAFRDARGPTKALEKGWLSILDHHRPQDQPATMKEVRKPVGEVASIHRSFNRN